MSTLPYLNINNASLGIEGCPGSKFCTLSSSSDLDQNILVLKKANFHTVVCLIDDDEIQRYSPNLLQAYKKHGIELLRYVIEDFYIPQNIESFNKFVDTIISKLNSKKNVFVHCLAGLGRSGLVLACVLIKYYPDLSYQEAISKVRNIRNGAIQNIEQERFIKDYYFYCRKQ